MPGIAVPLDNIAHVIQVALTPVFMLSGLGTLLNVFTARLARVTDHAEHAAELLRDPSSEEQALPLRDHLVRLRRRTLALDVAVALGVVGAAAISGATFVLFVGALRNAEVAWVLFVLFGLAVSCTIGALTAFLVETLLSWHGLKTEGPLPRPKQLTKS